MIARFEETSVLQEIVYLDPELNGDAEYFRARLRHATTWQRVRHFAFSPCMATLAGFAALLFLGVFQGR